MTTDAALFEVAAVLKSVPDLPDRLAELLLARRVLIHGQGRAGLALQALAMRLGQMGRDAHWLHDVAPPPLRPGDILLANASNGDLPTTVALLRRARELGAHAALITAASHGPALDVADTVLHLPAQTGQGAALLPLGGQYELALWVVGDMAVERLRVRLGLARDVFATGHVNLG